MEKEGYAHFEMIMAFVFFIGFVFFVFTILKPYNEKDLSYAVVDGIFDSLHDLAQTNLTKVFIRAESPNASCFYLNFTTELFSQELNHSKVLNISGEEINSQIIGNSLHLEENQTYYYLYYSPDFNDGTAFCNTNISNYTLGGIQEQKILSLKKLKDLESQYYTNYSILKRSLGVPPVYDFSIISEELGLHMEGTIPQTGQVLARDKLAQVLNSTHGEIINTKLTIKVW